MSATARAGRSTRLTLPGRARLVAVEAGLGGIVAGLAVGGTTGWSITGAGVVLGAGALTRRRGAWAGERLLDAARRQALALPAPEQPHRPDLGAVHTLLPALDVAEVADRNGPPLGVISDGHGHTVVAAFPAGTIPAVPAGTVARWLADDPARPVAAQLLVEQFAPPTADTDHRYQPAIAYRQLPYAQRPIAVRSWLALRYEPLAAPEAAARRGGGAKGGHAAIAGAAARLRAALAARGAPTTPLGAAELRDLLRHLGGTSQRTLTVSVAGQRDWHRLLAGLDRACPADRVVTAATLTLRGPELRIRAAVRVVGADDARTAAECGRIEAAGLAGPPAADQAAGFLATLPLARPARTPADATALVLAPDPDHAPEATAR